MHLANYTHEVKEILRGSLKTKLMGYVITLKSSFEDRIRRKKIMQKNSAEHKVLTKLLLSDSYYYYFYNKMTKDSFTFIDKGKANGQMVSITL